MDPSIPVAEPPVATASAPVMDVVPPPASAEPIAAPTAEVAPAAQPTPHPAKVDHKAKSTISPKAPKQSRPGVGLAIAATVVIVLALSAMATYAYLKTK